VPYFCYRADTNVVLLACLVAPGTTSHILNCDTTLAALAFLCSRMLSASKRARAATAIQRAWRSHMARKMQHRREVARDLAENCAAVVQGRTEILGAAEVITRWWREIKSHKQREQTLQRKALRKFSGRQSLGLRGLRRL
jgi:abnormal spindle-like microcephaly-associated protein